MGEGRSIQNRRCMGLWDNLCVSKCNGGLGFRELQSFNLVMLAKQGWKILNDPDSILVKFGRTSNILTVLSFKPSWVMLHHILGKVY